MGKKKWLNVISKRDDTLSVSCAKKGERLYLIELEGHVNGVYWEKTFDFAVFFEMIGAKSKMLRHVADKMEQVEDADNRERKEGSKRKKEAKQRAKNGVIN